MKATQQHPWITETFLLLQEVSLKEVSLNYMEYLGAPSYV